MPANIVNWTIEDNILWTFNRTYNSSLKKEYLKGPFAKCWFSVLTFTNVKVGLKCTDLIVHICQVLHQIVFVVWTAVCTFVTPQNISTSFCNHFFIFCRTINQPNAIIMQYLMVSIYNCSGMDFNNKRYTPGTWEPHILGIRCNDPCYDGIVIGFYHGMWFWRIMLRNV